MATLSEQLDAMLRLAPNWDGYGADAPIPDVVVAAKGMVALMAAIARGTGVDHHVRVYPTRVGGVQIEWEESGYEWECELMPDGSIQMLGVEKATGRVRPETFRPGEWAVAPGFLARMGEFASPVAAV